MIIVSLVIQLILLHRQIMYEWPQIHDAQSFPTMELTVSFTEAVNQPLQSLTLDKLSLDNLLKLKSWAF